MQSVRYRVYTGVRSRGAGGAVAPLHIYIERATPPSYCTSNRYCDSALAENLSSCIVVYFALIVWVHFKYDICLRMHQN